MCLTRLTPTTVPDKGICYKIFRRSPDPSFSTAPYRRFEFRGIGIKETAYLVPDSIACEEFPFQYYISGFHSFLTLEDARLYQNDNGLFYQISIVECEYEGVLHQGQQVLDNPIYTVDVIVTKHITQLRVVEAS